MPPNLDRFPFSYANPFFDPDEAERKELDREDAEYEKVKDRELFPPDEPDRAG